METAITLTEGELKSAVLEFVQREYGITLNYESITVEPGMDKALIVAAKIQRPKVEKDPFTDKKR